MVKRALRMTCSAQMHTKIADSVERRADRKKKLYAKCYTLNADSGFTMIELMVVVVVVSLFALMAQMHLFGLLRKSTFKAQVQELVSTMQMAASAAGESDAAAAFRFDPGCGCPSSCLHHEEQFLGPVDLPLPAALAPEAPRVGLDVHGVFAAGETKAGIFHPEHRRLGSRQHSVGRD